MAADPLPNVWPPVTLDASVDSWPLPEPHARFDLVLCINMLHISPWDTAGVGLLRGAGAVLRRGGALLTYGPHKVEGGFSSEGNRNFDSMLREKNPEWGLRNVDDVTREAAAHGLQRERVVDMPANNLCLIFRRI